MAEYDSEYLKESVGDVLAEALAQVSIHQPADPIEFVGRYLLNADANAKRHQKVFLICFLTILLFLRYLCYLYL